MGLFDRLFGNKPKEKGKYEGAFQMLNGYEPRFTHFTGEIYESELVRASINALATHISKLDVKTFGAAKPALQRKLAHGPNEFQTWTQFLARAATIYYNCNTLFITPVWDDYGEISGIFTPVPERCEMVQFNGVPYLRYEFSRGQKAAVELEYCGIMTRMQYKNDFFGENNRALIPTMDLIHIQDQGIKEGVKNSATFRFMARYNNIAFEEDIQKEQERFNKLAGKKGGMTLLFPKTYEDLKQIDSKPFVADSETMKTIRDRVNSYFGTNDDILMNKAYGDTWTAFYEGDTEPWAVQLSDVLLKLFQNLGELSGNDAAVVINANRMVYMATKERLNISAELIDRGVLNRDEVREIWNLPPIPDGNGKEYVIRGEYMNADEKVNTGSKGNSKDDDDNEEDKEEEE